MPLTYDIIQDVPYLIVQQLRSSETVSQINKFGKFVLWIP